MAQRFLIQLLYYRRLVAAAFVILLLGSIVGSARAEDAATDGVSDEHKDDYLQKFTGIDLHGFANMGWADDNSTDNHRRYSRGFYLNNFDLLYTPDTGTRMRLLAEIVFEPDAESQQPTFDAERLQAGYVFNKNITLWAGRFHTPIGYYVISYHHGMQLQTAVEKPRFLDFEDHFGVVPVHSNGLWLNTNYPMGNHRFSFMAWLSNSDRLVTDGNNFSSLDFNMARSDNHNLGWGARVNLIGGGDLDGLQVGAMIMAQTIDWMGAGSATYGGNSATQPGQTSPATPGLGGVNDTTANPNTGSQFSSNFLMYGVHAVYENHGIEFLNEIYAFSNGVRYQNFANTLLSPPPTTAAPQGRLKSAAGYSQLAYWIHGISAPYIRFERAAFNTRDPFFGGQYNGLPYTKYAVGYRYNVADTAAIKVEGSKTTFNAMTNTNNGQAYNDIHVDYSVRF